MTRTDALRVEAAERAIRGAGYELRYVEWCEDSQTPSPFPFPIADGLTDYSNKVVKVRKALSGRRLANVLDHELRHVLNVPGHDEQPGHGTIEGGQLVKVVPHRNQTIYSMQVRWGDAWRDSNVTLFGVLKSDTRFVSREEAERRKTRAEAYGYTARIVTTEGVR